MNVQLVTAGSLTLLGAAIHGLAGELLVVRRLSAGALPPTRFGGPDGTRAMIHASWHITTVAFLGVGCALLLAGTVLDGDAAQSVAVLGACMSAGFAAVVLAQGLGSGLSPRFMLRHPAPVLLTATAALALWGAL